MTSVPHVSAWGKQPSIATAQPNNPANNQPSPSSATPSANITSVKPNDVNGKKKQSQPSPRAHNNQPHHQSNKQSNNPSMNHKPKVNPSAPSPSNANKQPNTPSNNQTNNQTSNQSNNQSKEQSKDQSKESKEPKAASPATEQSPSHSTDKKPAAAPFVPSPQSELTALLQIGNCVTITTQSGSTHTGDVFVYDQDTQALALETIKPSTNQANSSELRDWSLYNARNIKVTLIKKADPSVRRSLPAVDQPRLVAKEAKAISDRQAAAAKIGQGVTKEGQRLFDVLSKLFPARWEQTTIVLMDALRLKAPYDSKSLSGGSAQQQQRIVKIIEAERAKMGLQ